MGREDRRYGIGEVVGECREKEVGGVEGAE